MTKRRPLRSNLTVRKRKNGYLIMNRDTSGFHILTFDTYKVLEECDGKSTVEQIIEKLAKKFKIDESEMNAFKKDVIDCISKLEKRRIIKWK